MGDEKLRHYRMDAEPARLGLEGQPLGRPTVPARFMVEIGGGERVPIFTPEEAVDESVKVFERKRLLATALVAREGAVRMAGPPQPVAPSGPPPAGTAGDVMRLEARLLAARRELNDSLNSGAVLLRLVVEAKAIVTALGDTGVQTLESTVALGQRCVSFLELVGSVLPPDLAPQPPPAEGPRVKLR